MDAKKDYNAIGNLTIEEISPGLLQDIKDIAVEVAGIEEANTTSFDASKYKQGHIMYLVDDVQEAIDKLTDLVDNTASSTEDGLMSKTDKIKLDGVEAGANKYVHPSSHDASMITESSSKRFVSDTEKSTWNAKASTAVATTSANGLMSSTDKSKLDGITAGANKVEASTTNGKIKINGTETTVYTHPTGTNPHGTTKADIGLSNVDNTSDLNKPISTAVQTALNGKANSSHTHTSTNISDATNANTANMIVKRDASGNFSAGTITASLSGNASTATKWATARTLTLTGGVTGSASIDGSGNVSLATTLAAHNQASNTINAMTGYAKASAVSAITTTDTLNTAIGKLEKALDSKQASGSYAASSHTHNYAGSSSAGGAATTALACTGNSATATKLQTARTINGVSFDGSSNITITASANGGNADTLGGKSYSEFVQMPLTKLSATDLQNANYPRAYRTTIADGSQIGLPVANWYHIDYFRHLDNNGYGFQMAYPLNHNGAICARWSSGTSWQSWKKINDGGNADTVDGVHANSFLQGSASQVVTGLKEFISQSVGSDYFNPALQIREVKSVGGNNRTTPYAPAIGFHWANTGASSIAMHADGNFYFRAQGYSDSYLVYRNLIANDYVLPDGTSLQSLKSSVVSGKQLVVNAINDKLGYASGLTTSHAFSDYNWWITNKIQSVPTINSTPSSSVHVTGYFPYVKDAITAHSMSQSQSITVEGAYILFVTDDNYEALYISPVSSTIKVYKYDGSEKATVVNVGGKTSTDCVECFIVNPERTPITFTKQNYSTSVRNPAVRIMIQ